MNSSKVRDLFLRFFELKGHQIVVSAPMVIQNDPTLMFANSGMNQFKDIFLGNTEAKYNRIANSQKCLRVSGKHNDLEQVGNDTYHHTMFEMLGNWSFGDYFKEDAIAWAWEFLINECKLDTDRLYVTFFEGSKADGLAKDEDTYNIWKKYIAKDRIIGGNKKDNFWEMEEIGPCGPCSEIHYDNRIDEERKKINGNTLVNQNHHDVIEIWNLVFMQYNHKSNKTMEELPNQHVDTGMGFERLCMIMQGKQSNYDTDIFRSLIKTIVKLSGKKYNENQKVATAMRVVADHIRAIAFSIADGQLPSNIKAGYVIRRILRRAVRYAYNFLDLRSAFMYKLVDVLIRQLGDQFTELKKQKKLIQKVIKEEEDSFLRTLEEGSKRIEQIIAKSDGVISGKAIFELYDTYGFPVDLTALILSEQDLSFNQADFDASMQEQKDRSKKAGKVDKEDWKVLIDDEKEEFVGYNKLETEIKITRYRKIKSNNGEQYQLVFNITPFYPEGGGQVGDTGVIINKNQSTAVVDTQKENNLIIHFTNTLPKNVNDTFLAKVNTDDRIASARNHTATHLLHESLRKILGEHVVQKGSLVCPDYLRFDFSHFSKITTKELQEIEKMVNFKILANITLNEQINLPLMEAKSIGAIMLFGEKYEDLVRMIQFDSSMELCGGTHVNATGEIGLFKIFSEGSIASGIRRIEAKTGVYAMQYLNQKEQLISDISTSLKNKDIEKSIEKLITDNKRLEKQLSVIKKANVSTAKDDFLKLAVDSNGIRLITQKVDMDEESIKNICFQLRKEENLAVVLGSENNGKAFLSIMLTDDLVEKGLNANTIIREMAKEIEGRGGGQPFFASAGGSNTKGIDNALYKAKEILE